MIKPMYNELAAQRKRRIKEAYIALNDAITAINAAISDEYEQVEVVALGLIADSISEAIEGCLNYFEEMSDEAKADEFLYGHME